MAGLKLKRRRLRAIGWLLATALVAPTVVAAQVGPPSRAAQASRGGSRELNAALSRLASNPADLEALIAAGNAALALGDSEAAVGFLSRADRLSPNNPQIKATLAGAMLRGEDPYEALRLFAEAERAGASVAAIAGERGLAYDLVGATVEAQRHYRQALASAYNDEVIRRLALSQAIARDRRGFEATLLPQLQRHDAAAWRTRVFGLAILGAEQEAITLASATMPRNLAQAIVPYLRYMPRLTPAQQAAAANLGQFPRAAQIGRDDPRAARYASARAARGARGPDAGLIPTGQPLGARPGQPPAAKSPDGAVEREARRTKRSARHARSRSTAPAPASSAVAAVRPPPMSRAVPSTNGYRSPPPSTYAAPTTAPPARMPPAPAPSSGAPVFPRSTFAAPAVEQPPRTATAPVYAAAPPAPPRIVAGPTLLGAATTPAQPPAVAGPGAISLAMPTLSLPAAPAASPLSAPPATVAVPTSAPFGSPAAVALPAATASPAPATAQPPAPPVDLAAAFSDFRPPAEEQRSATPAIDLSRIVPVRPSAAPASSRGADPARIAREAPPEPPSASRRSDSKSTAAAGKGAKLAARGAKAASPAAPTHASRIWVQVATGRDREALAFDWRRLTRLAPAAFKGRKAWLSPWGQSSRLLVGPFESQAQAQGFINRLRDENVAGFAWTSAAGQVVDALPVK